MAIHIKIFAGLAADLGVSEDNLAYEMGETVHQTLVRLQQKHCKVLSITGVRAAVNHCFVPWDAVVTDGDEVAFIPPVAGG